MNKRMLFGMVCLVLVPVMGTVSRTGKEGRRHRR